VHTTYGHLYEVKKDALCGDHFHLFVCSVHHLVPATKPFPGLSQSSVQEFFTAGTSFMKMVAVKGILYLRA
jgi:hypothetical protein